MTAPHDVLDESDYLALVLADTEPEPTDGAGCGCVPVFGGEEVPRPRPASVLASATNSLRTERIQP